MKKFINKYPTYIYISLNLSIYVLTYPLIHLYIYICTQAGGLPEPQAEGCRDELVGCEDVQYPGAEHPGVVTRILLGLV